MAAAPSAPHVSQRHQPFLDFRVDAPGPVGRVLPRGPGDHGRERPVERRHALPLRHGEIDGFGRVVLQIVQLGPRRTDVLEPAVLHRLQLAPPVVIAGKPGFRVRDEIQARTEREGLQARALDLFRRRHAEEVKRGRHHVDDPDLIGDLPYRHVRSRDDEGNANRGIVDEEAVLLLAVLAEHLAVIANHDHQRLGEPPARGQGVEQAADLCVGRRHFGVIRTVHRGGKARAIGFGSLVRRVRIVQVHEREERPIAILCNPCERGIDDFGAGPLDVVHARRGVEFLEVEIVEEAIEALRNAPAPVEDEGGHESAGAEPVLAQHLGQRDLLVTEVEATVVADAVPARERAGQQ